MSYHSSPSSGGLTGSCNCRCVDDSWKAYSVGEPACYPEVGCYRAYRNGGFSLVSSCNHSSTCNCAENAYFHSATCYEAGCYSPASSRGVTAPGCEGNTGECNVPYLLATRGASTRSSAITNLTDATLARLAFEYVQDATP